MLKTHMLETCNVPKCDHHVGTVHWNNRTEPCANMLSNYYEGFILFGSAVSRGVCIYWDPTG